MLRAAAAFLQHAASLAADLFRGYAQFTQDIHGFAFGRAHQPEQKVFGANVMMPHAPGFLDGKFQHLLDTRREVDLAAAVLTNAAQALCHFLDSLRFESQITQHAPGNPAFLLNQTQQQMLGADLRLTHPFRFLVRQAEHPSSSLGKTLHTGQGKILLNLSNHSCVRMDL